jgi:phthalate 4,5-dioxygenase
MLSKEENEFLCRVGPGTPMGQLFRCFWLPALLPSELPEPDCSPVRVRLLGEDLVAFRDTEGRVAFLDALCPHRGAPLFFGRNEEAGLRCVYHGWKFDVGGNCIDMPNEPAQSNFKDKIQQTSYPAREFGGLIWIYMGSTDPVPELPRMPWAEVAGNQRHISKWIQESNFVQGMEGEIDNSHTMFLHGWFADSGEESGDLATARAIGMSRIEHTTDFAPTLTALETDYGFVYGSRRTRPDGKYYWRVVHWLVPSFSVLGADGTGKCWVPRDDESTWTFGFNPNLERALTSEDIERIESGARVPPRLIPGTFWPLANKQNDYLIDREAQRTKNFTGIFGVNEQDRAMQEPEPAGPIFDRRREHLGASDTAVILARRILIRLARELQQGRRPFAAVHGDLYRVRGMSLVDASVDFAQLLEKYRATVAAPSPQG